MNSDIFDEWDAVATGFSAVANSVGDDQWENPSPCEGWTARDVVGHLITWVPPLFNGAADTKIEIVTTAQDNPAAAWAELDQAIRSILADPEASARSFSHPMAGDHRLDEAVEMLVTGDVLVHTWDLATAVGRAVVLYAPMVKSMSAGLEEMGDALAASGHYGPAVSVPGTADAQTKLLALTGRVLT